jgi:hypothetical protein
MITIKFLTFCTFLSEIIAIKIKYVSHNFDFYWHELLLVVIGSNFNECFNYLVNLSYKFQFHQQ